MKKPTLRQTLIGLGKTKSEVARKLRDNKIKGSKKMKSCPVALYLQKKGFKDAGVGPQSVFTINQHGWNKIGTLTNACRDFIQAFDKGEYKALHKKKK